MAGLAVSRTAEDSAPPVAPIAVGSLCLIVIGGIYLAAHIPGPVSLLPAYGLLVGAFLLMGVNVVLLRRLSHFAWPRFFQVGKWALLAYAISAGMLEYVFVLDKVPAAELLLLTLMLLVYAIDIPLILAFTVARYQAPDS